MTDRPTTIISLPWGMIQEPALGPSILVAALRAAGEAASIKYFQHALLRHLTYDSYCRLGDVFALNDFVFTAGFEREIDRGQQAALADICNQLWLHNLKWRSDRRFTGPESIADYVLEIRNRAIPAYLDGCRKNVLADNPKLIAFSCLYDQTIPSLALAKLIHEERPEIPLVMGGYALRGPLASHVVDCFDWIDAVVEGPGEKIIVDMARSINVDSGLPEEFRGRIETSLSIDQSPTPDYSDFAASIASLEADDNISIEWRVIPYEASRGCWWGAKSHCIFCGIKSEDLAYSFKAPDRVMSDLDAIHEEHRKSVFRFVDYIIPLDYFGTLFTDLQARASPYRLTCETKSNLNSDRIAEMRAAGFVEVRPGIESFSTAILKGMRKGVTSPQNLSFIRTSFEAGMIVHYNILYGFPFDSVDEIRRMTEAIPRFFHLPPPSTVLEVLTTRFSPMQELGYATGTPSKQAHKFYEVVFSRETIERYEFDTSKYCYYFESLVAFDPAVEAHYGPFRDVMDRWSQAYYKDKSTFLVYEETGDGITFFDSRFGPPTAAHVAGTSSDLYRLCCKGPVSAASAARSSVSAWMS